MKAPALHFFLTAKAAGRSRISFWTLISSTCDFGALRWDRGDEKQSATARK
ncbi:MAG: hypothetical protein LBG98_01140 [Puniceicoccales bacterium]|nr:hypothetical protein [Puniceicoccales bacterium]